MALLSLEAFLGHLWRYWLVARASQAEAIQEKRNFRFRPLVSPERTDMLIRALWNARAAIHIGTGESDFAAAYYPRLQALRLARSGLAQFLDRTDVRDENRPEFRDEDFQTFYARQPFSDRVREFVKEPLYDRWRAQESIDLADYLHAAFFDEHTAGLPPNIAQLDSPLFFQTAIQSVERGVAWIGFRDLAPSVAKRFPTWTQERCTKDLQTAPLSTTRIEIFGGQAPLSWISDVSSVVRDLTEADDDLVQRLALASLEERGWHQVDAANGTVILDTTPPALLVSCRAQSPELFETNLSSVISAAARCADTRGFETYDIALATTAEGTTALETLAGFGDESSGLRTCHVIDADALLSVASRRPELWTATAGHQMGFIAVTERRSLQRVLGLEEGDVENAPRHPAIMSAEAGGATVLRIVGKAGSGKSTVLYHLASAHFESALILVATLGRNARALEQFIRTSSRPVIVLLDDLERQIAIPTAAWEVASLLAAARAAEQSVRVLISCLSSERESVQRVIGSVLVRSRVAELDLDNIARPDAEEFLGEIIRRTAPAYGVEVSAGELLTHARTWTVDGGTPREVVRRVAELATGLFQQRGVDYWRSRFLALLREGRKTETEVLQVLAVLRAAEGAAMPRSLVQQLFCGAFDRTSTEFEHAFAVLIADGWIRAWRDELYADTVQLDLELTHLLREGTPTSTYRQLVAWIALNVSAVAFEYRDWLRRHAKECLRAWGDGSGSASLHEDWLAEADSFIAAGGDDRLATECDLTLWRLFVRSLGSGETPWAERLIAQWPLANEDPVILQGVLEECGMNGWFDQAQEFIDWLFFERSPELVVSLLESMILHDGTETIIDEVTRELRSRGLPSLELEQRVLAIEAVLRDDDCVVVPDLLAAVEKAVQRGALAFARHLVDNLPETTFAAPERRRLASLRQIVRESGTSIPTARQLFERLHTAG